MGVSLRVVIGTLCGGQVIVTFQAPSNGPACACAKAGEPASVIVARKAVATAMKRKVMAGWVLWDSELSPDAAVRALRHFAANRELPAPRPALAEPGDAGLGLVECLLTRGEGQAENLCKGCQWLLPSASLRIPRTRTCRCRGRRCHASFVELVFEGREKLVGHGSHRWLSEVAVLPHRQLSCRPEQADRATGRACHPCARTRHPRSALHVDVRQV